jgi:hypothetical protein
VIQSFFLVSLDPPNQMRVFRINIPASAINPHPEKDEEERGARSLDCRTECFLASQYFWLQQKSAKL